MADRDNNRNNNNNNYNNRNNDYQRNNGGYRNPRPQEEPKKEEVKEQDRDITVDLNSAKTKTSKMVNKSANKKVEDLKLELTDVNNMLDDFYSRMIDDFGAQGFKDKDGNPYNSSNYHTTEEKLSALEKITYSDPKRTSEFFRQNTQKVEQIKKAKTRLRDKAKKLLDKQKEVIDYNNELIKDAKVDIHKREKEVESIENKSAEEQKRWDGLETQKSEAEKQKQEIEDKIQKLNEAKKILLDKLDDMRRQEMAQPASGSGKQKNMQNNGYYQTQTQEIRSINDQITEQERFLSDVNSTITLCNKEQSEIDTLRKNLKDQKDNLESQIEEDKKNLNNLESTTNKLKSKHEKDIGDLNDAFNEQIKGFVNDDIKLEYSENKEKEEKTEETHEDMDQSSEQAEDKKDAPKAAASTNASTAPVPVELSERELANNIIYHLTHSSASDIRDMLNGPGFSDIIDAIDSCSAASRRDIIDILDNAQEDLELPDYAEYRRQMKSFMPSGVSVDDVYDCLFQNGEFKDFNSLSKKDIDMLQHVLDKYDTVKKNLSEDQLAYFDENFAQFAKMGSILQRCNMNNRGLASIFNRIRNPRLQASRNRLLFSISKYTSKRFDTINSQMQSGYNLRKSLGQQVEETPEYKTGARGNASRDRGLRGKVGRGEL